MANKWTIIPDDSGASIDENGNATFPKNRTSEPIEYTIIYNDVCSASATVIQNGVTCDDYDFSAITNVSFSYQSGETVTIAQSNAEMEQLNATCPEWISINASEIDSAQGIRIF